MSQDTVLVVGDFHIPQRTVDIPLKFKEIITPGKVTHVVCTGNFGDRMDWLKSLGGNLHIVRGDFDEGNLTESKTFSIGEWKVGVVHGHQIIPWGDKEALSNYQRVLDCDLLLHGHTHVLSIENSENKFFVNPGSITGSYSSITSEINPSFVVISFSKKEASVYSYELIDDNLSINVTQLIKN